MSGASRRGLGFTWIDKTVTVQDAIDDASTSGVGVAPIWTSARCPRPGWGWGVNIGMWLAVHGGRHWSCPWLSLRSLIVVVLGERVELRLEFGNIGGEGLFA